jgi:hypothetical protein
MAAQPEPKVYNGILAGISMIYKAGIMAFSWCFIILKLAQPGAQGVYVCMCVYIFVYTHMHTCVCRDGLSVSFSLCMYVYVYIYIYIYIYIYGGRFADQLTIMAGLWEHVMR